MSSLDDEVGFFLDWVEMNHGQMAAKFQAIEPFHSAFLAIAERGAESSFLLKGTLQDLIVPLDVTIMADLPGRPDEDYAIRRFSLASGASQRGKVRVFHHRAVMSRTFVFNKGKEYVYDEFFAPLKSGGGWTNTTASSNHYLSSQLHESIGLIIGIAIERQAQWKVIIGKEGGPSVLFATDPTGVKELFRTRDVPDGRTRRQALRHWVSQHWRRKHDNPEDLAFVRKHLRGQENFIWSGMKCSIVPAATEIQQAEEQP
jgi:hypothetical protein